MRDAFDTYKELSETTVSKLLPGITAFPDSSWLTVSQLMGIWNKRKFDVTRVRTFPFLGSGPFLTKSELGKLRNLESGNLFLGGTREVSRPR